MMAANHIGISALDTDFLMVSVLVSLFGTSNNYCEIKDIAVSLIIEWE